MSEVFYTVYQTICLVNGKTYIGCHKTKNPNDSYLGSGTLFRKALMKYGKENFKKEVLFIFDNPEEMLEKEQELVIVDPGKTYNLDHGGWPGFGSRTVEAVRYATSLGQQVLKKRKEEDPDFLRRYRDLLSLRLSERWASGDLSGKKEDLRYNQQLMTQAAMTVAASEKRKATLKRIQHQAGETNSQYGTCWITKDGMDKKIPKEALQSYLDDGFTRGRANGKPPIPGTSSKGH